jgi:hypothetical protein
MAAVAIVAAERRPWNVATPYLAALGTFFYASYSLANWAASRRSHVPSLVFGWEHYIPFVAWTIVPYWSIDLLYCLSFFICRNCAELDRHAKRLLVAQILSVSSFLLIPLRFSFDRPEILGVFGGMFAALASFDRPFNQAPSLHLSLAVILAAKYSDHVDGMARGLLQGWFVLIGASALTTYQHHFVDVPTGIWVGLLCIALVPESPVTSFEVGFIENCHWKLGGLYLVGSAFLGILASWAGGWAWWLLWPASSCLIVACIYWTGQPEGFRKHNGYLQTPMRWLLAPYLAAARLNARLWTRREVLAFEIASQVWIGRFPGKAELRALHIGSIVDMTAELPAAIHGANYRSVPVLDLTVPSPAQLNRAVAAIESLQPHRPTLVCCALGRSRSAAAVAAWLFATRHTSTIDSAIALVERQRPGVVLTQAHRAGLYKWASERTDA